MSHDEQQPTINFGGQWIPAHEAWKRLETLSSTTDILERLNAEHPDLATEYTEQIVHDVRKRLRSIEVAMPARPGGKSGDDRELISQLLGELSVEEVLDVLHREHGLELSLHTIIQAAPEGYFNSLQREANEFARNAISPEQTAELWNDLGRPAPGGGLWNAKKVLKITDSNSG